MLPRPLVHPAVGWTIAGAPALSITALLLYFPAGYQDGPYREIARFTDSVTEESDTVYTRDPPNPYLNTYGHYFLRRFQGSDCLEKLGGAGIRLQIRAERARVSLAESSVRKPQGGSHEKATLRPTSGSRVVRSVSLVPERRPKSGRRAAGAL
ncbi:MAG TPA: hypothetical protein VM492_06910 [Sumerlaeia bacterium]|nr:hypothetical protein [Sumerlaeia bacterium]